MTDPDPFKENAGDMVSQQDWIQFITERTIPSSAIVKVFILRRLFGEIEAETFSDYYFLSIPKLKDLLDNFNLEK